MQIIESSATPAQTYNLTLAFQRTLGFDLPSQITDRPTVQVLGSCFKWTSPNLYLDHAVALLAEYDRLERGVFNGAISDTQRKVPLVDIENVIVGLLSCDGENAEYDRACIEIAADLGMTLVSNA